MKLRIQGNSIRLRLKQGEVRQLAEQGVVAEEVSFGESRLGYRLVARPDLHELQAAFDGQTLEVRVPAQRARHWAATDEVGMQAEQPLPEGGRLRILVEKDFKCLTDRPHEDESDSFPHPGEGKLKC